ncbi:MAG: efflux RND transporter periplasmic adaptor subunit [Verrucomicrobiales bacterium]|nr:efflux RND transporter periplasmic adaptor subunit [Verrucomicrobiales bacterium]
MKKSAQIILIIIIGTIAAFVYFGLVLTKPVAEIKERIRYIPTVDIWEAEVSDYDVIIKSQGVTKPKRSTILAAEVAGKVVAVSPKFEVGEYFDKGEIILEIDMADYEAIEFQAASVLADAKLALEKERALAKQALIDWKALGGDGTPNDLVLRKPQMQSALAKVVSAKAGFEKAARDLDRTKIRSPYKCQIRESLVELGSTLAAGSAATAVDSANDFELRLPVSLEDYAFIDVIAGAPLTLEAKIAGVVYKWRGELLRTEGQVDQSSQSVFFVANVNAVEGDKFLSSGLFLNAKISGKKLKDVYALPRKALYGKNKIIIVGSDNKVSSREVVVIRTERNKVIVKNGIENGERIATTPILNVINGMEVNPSKNVTQ